MLSTDNVRMMFLLSVMAVVIIGASAAPQQAPLQSPASDVTPVPIVSQSETNNADGSFNYR